MQYKKLLILISLISSSLLPVQLMYGMTDIKQPTDPDIQMMDKDKLKAMQLRLQSNLKFQQAPSSTYTNAQNQALKEQAQKAVTTPEPQKDPSPVSSPAPQEFSDELAQRLQQQSLKQKPVQSVPQTPVPMLATISPALANIQRLLSNQGPRVIKQVINICVDKEIITSDDRTSVQITLQQNFNDGKNYLFSILALKDSLLTAQPGHLESLAKAIEESKILEQKSDKPVAQNSPVSQRDLTAELKKKQNPGANTQPPQPEKKQLPPKPIKPKHITHTKYSTQTIKKMVLTALANKYFIYGTPSAIGIIYIGYRINQYLKQKRAVITPVLS